MERTIKPETLKNELAGKLILDVRRVADREAAPAHLPGAQWKNPEQLAEWADDLPKGQDIVLYCARGGSVSNSVVDTLQARGLKARFIEGGIEGWKAAGGEVVGP
ncbi:MAG: sulfurtransferase [Thiobacillus sp. SCN 63-374]|nr:MAG: sulfurtransferase [Thiobacillus sp. SCN 63-374]